ncbi:MAG: hypothetical protein RBT45_03410 [Acholeplasmataceae bacterium]|jgi:hypothetical protein|nr:hypothetical protein [Acholeplasmataceae bacterium]
MNHELKYKIFEEKISKMTNEIFGDSLKQYPYEKPARLDNNSNKVIMILGINPAGDHKDHSYFLQYIPNAAILNKYNSKSDSDGLFYRKYFHPNFELVSSYQPKLWWTSYDEKIMDVKKYFIKDNKIMEWQELFEAIEIEKKKNSPYIVFCDLLQNHHTASKVIKKYINDNIDLVLSMYDAMLDYYNPRLVIVTNSFVSRLLMEKYNIEEVTSFDHPKKNTHFILSGFVSSGRMDPFSIQRLKKEIDEYKSDF